MYQRVASLVARCCHSLARLPHCISRGVSRAVSHVRSAIHWLIGKNNKSGDDMAMRVLEEGGAVVAPSVRPEEEKDLEMDIGIIVV